MTWTLPSTATLPRKAIGAKWIVDRELEARAVQQSRQRRQREGMGRLIERGEA